MNKSTSKILSILLLLFIVSASWTGAKAQYWEAQGGKGVYIGKIYYYKDDIAHTAVVTNKGMSGIGSPAGSNTYSEAVAIPETFDIDGEVYTVIGIQDYAFYGSTELKSVSIPKTVTTIGEQAFWGCDQLKEISVDPQNGYFYGEDGVLFNKYKTELIVCAKTRTDAFTVPSSVKKIHDYAFYGCKSITKVVLPNGLKEIGDFAFYNCTGITSLNIPTNLTSFGSYAFGNASALTSDITIPANISKINEGAFQGCEKISKVTFHEGITEFADNAFYGCKDLKSIELPSAINKLGMHAFRNTGLTSINIPNSITEIPSFAFAECKLTSITLPEGLTTIKASAFANNGTTIASVSIPKSVENIDNNAFNGTNVTNFYINNIPNRTTIGGTTPFKADNVTIHVFTMMKSIFENATNWSKYKGHFVADIDITHVESITLDNTKMTVLTSSLNKLNATINPDDARVKDVVFTSSNPDVILISNSATGDFVAGANEGTATITCTAMEGSGAFAKCDVNVVKSFTPAASVTLNKTEKSMEVDNTLQLTATIAPSNATYKNILWISSDEDIATVSNSGLVTAKAPGVATITAISGDGAARANCEITVSYGGLTLKDGDAYTNDETLPVRKLTYARNFKNTNWQPLYIPFRMSHEDWSDQFEVARLLNMHCYDNNNDGVIDDMKIEIVRVKEGTLKENHPYLIKAKTTGQKTITLNDATIYPAEKNTLQCSSTEYTYNFNGVYETTTGLKSIGGYFMSSGSFISPADDNSKVNSYRFYMQVIEKGGQFVTSINNAKIIVVDEFGVEETTAINSVESDQDNVTAVYNANGIKQASTKQGLNIIKMADGTTKKIFVK